MATKLSSFQAKCAALIQQCRLAPGIPTAWLPISYVMGHIQIESGFDPNIRAGDFSSTGSVGLMQVTAETAKEVIDQYPAAKLGLPQTDPYTSICTGMLYLRTCHNYLVPHFGAAMPYSHICVAYNEGPGNAARGVPDTAYYFKWLSAQQVFAYLDQPPMMMA